MKVALNTKTQTQVLLQLMTGKKDTWMIQLSTILLIYNKPIHEIIYPL